VLAIAISLLMPKASPPPQEFTRSSSVLELGYTVMTYLGGYSFGPSPSDIQTHGALRALSSHPFQVGMLCALLLLIVIACGSEFSSHRKLWASASPSALPGKELSLLMLSIGIVAGVALVSGFPYNIRYTLPGLFGFLGLLAAFSTALKRTWLQRGLIASLLTISLWADAQWFFDPAYRKGDSRAVAHWLTQNQDRVQTWTTLPDYLSLSLNWYLKPYPAVAERLQPPAKANTTSFPPTPDVLIIGRRHHILQPEELIAAYKAAAGKTRVITTFTGFELYVRDAAR
jgi:hypothetical protein